MKFFKNIPKNAMRVGVGTLGAFGSDFVAEKLVSKLPKVGDKPTLKHLATSLLGIAAMDWSEDAGFGAAVVQARSAGYSFFPKAKEFTGISDPLSEDVVSEIDNKIQDDILKLKENAVSGEPVYGNNEFSYSGEPG